MYDLAIIGGGPAGVSAGVYASRKNLKTVFIAETIGGQSVVSDGIENWIGEIKISGEELAKKLENHLVSYARDIVDIKKGERVSEISGKTGDFTLKTQNSEYKAKSVLITTGSNRRKLSALNADRLEHKGLTYCASCDGPLFKDMEVAVVGGGNSALESAMQLLAYTKKVYLIHRNENLRADPVTVKAVTSNPKLELILNAEITEVLGEKFVSGIKYKQNGEEKELALSGIFVEIGAVPATGFVENLLELEENKTIKIDPWTGRTSAEGVWAAGDVTNVKYHQNNIASGDAVRALEDLYLWVKSRS